MNQLILTGRITKELELRKTSNDKSIVVFDLAVRRNEEITDFITVKTYGNLAENLYKYQGKGSLIGIIGSYQIDKYQNDKGENRYVHYVYANNIEFMNSKNENQVNQTVDTQHGTESIKLDDITLSDDDLPF